MCLHGFTDTWRSWELVLPDLERHHDVLAPTLPGHAGGPPLEGEVSDGLLADAVEHAMDVPHRLPSWPSAAARYRTDWLPHADWVELEGVGHCPQLDIRSSRRS